jgi:hypothetical protein
MGGRRSAEAAHQQVARCTRIDKELPDEQPEMVIA